MLRSDDSRACAEELFSPFDKHEFPLDLEAERLQRLLSLPPSTTVPVSEQAVHAGQLWTLHGIPLFAEALPNQPLAFRLHNHLLKALEEKWPAGKGSELLHTVYWSIIGFNLPELAADILEFPATVNR